ncbi:MAG: DMT family transporter [Paludibacterium sp.]|uniref:DMT family transporter n=1 Tax=Paludibacterium sp. TaxID=1917523 RepID=UPI0025E4172D|nr:DMT family transporter [Paludibacterium sp.]MBV8048564.1 DMT family transporter [Paludibacterium sp.]MBV8648113.1 DMT family transporter [Paludibacterium sp.]
MQKNPTLGHYLLLLAIALIWGAQFIFNQIVIRELPPLTLAAGRAGIGALTLALIGLFMPDERRQAAAAGRRLLPTYLLLAFFEALLPLLLLGWGQTQVESSEASILMGTIPIFTIVLAPLFVTGPHWRLPAILSVATGFAGIVVLVLPGVSGHGAGSLLGALSVLGAAASVSISLLLFNRLGSLSPVITVRNVLALAALPLIVLAAAIDRPWTLHVSADTLWSLLVLGVFCAGIVYLMFARLIQLAGSVFTSLTNYLVPPVGVFIGAVIASEQIGVNAWLALVLIAAALAVNQPALFSRRR